MLQAISRFFRRRADDAQLDLLFEHPSPKTADELHRRLRQLGLKRIERVSLTTNRHVMVSFGGGALRVHEGYLAAPEPVLQSIVQFIEGRTRAERRDAQKRIVSFPVAVKAGPRRREQTHPADALLAAQVAEWHERYNADLFGGALETVDVRVSRRMKSRLGHYSPASGELSAEIAISRSHIKRHGWPEALHTLLHEMVHQWQDETSGVIDHGAAFRKKAREVGVAPRARRTLKP